MSFLSVTCNPKSPSGHWHTAEIVIAYQTEAYFRAWDHNLTHSRALGLQKNNQKLVENRSCAGQSLVSKVGKAWPRGDQPGVQSGEAAQPGLGPRRSDARPSEVGPQLAYCLCSGGLLPVQRGLLVPPRRCLQTGL